MFNLDNLTEKDENNGWPSRKLIIGASGSGKTNYLLNSIQRDTNIVDKIYLCSKDLEEPKYKLLIDKREKAGINFNNDPTAFIEYYNFMDDILRNIEDYNKKKKKKRRKKAQQILKDLFIRCKKIKYFYLFFNTILFFSAKRCKIEFYTLYFI